MAKKRSSRSYRRTKKTVKKTVWRNTRYPLARKPLRFSPQKTIQPHFEEIRPNRTVVRRERPQRSKKQAGIKRLTLQANVVHTDEVKNKTCLRRLQRKEIIHAIGKAGMSGQKKPNNNTRNIKC
jgi:hypothetical protein